MTCSNALQLPASRPGTAGHNQNNLAEQQPGNEQQPAAQQQPVLKQRNNTATCGTTVTNGTGTATWRHGNNLERQ
jgi:hypothetical protein